MRPRSRPRLAARWRLPSRRDVLQGAGALGVAVLAPGCGSGDAVPPGPESHLFQTCDLQALPMLDSSDIITGLQQRLRSAGIEPCHPAAE